MCAINASKFPILNFHFFSPFHTLKIEISFSVKYMAKHTDKQLLIRTHEIVYMHEKTSVFTLIFQPLFVIFVSGYDPNKQPIL